MPARSKGVPGPLALQTLSHRAMYLLGDKRRLEGFEVSLAVDKGELRRVLLLLGRALHLLGSVRPDLLRAFRRDCRRIVVWPGIFAGGSWLGSLRMCVLDRQVFRREPDAAVVSHVALLLVHEGVHARLEHYGIYTNPANELRVERLCTLAQLRVARRLPNASVWLRALETQLATLATIYSPATKRQRVEQMAAGLPGWARPLLRWWMLRRVA